MIPLAVFAAVAAAGGDDTSSTIGLGPGATVRGLFRTAILAGVNVCASLTFERVQDGKGFIG